MPPLSIDTSDGRDCSRPLLFECAWEVANKGRLHSELFFSSPCPAVSPMLMGPTVPPWFTLIHCAIHGQDIAYGILNPGEFHCITAANLITDPLLPIVNLYLHGIYNLNVPF
jgi:hypothetical protein